MWDGTPLEGRTILLAAEQGLTGLGVDWVALRPVVVYGPGVQANMAQLIRLARSRLRVRGL